MATLCVNVDHVATLRQARGGREPDPVHAAMQAELGGSRGVTIHLREDRRHAQERDVRLIREVASGHLNLEMAATEAMVDFALSVRPDIATIVPERREELTTEGGLGVVSAGKELGRSIARLREAGITVALFIDPKAEQIEASKQAGADEIELHTGPYANARGRADIARQLQLLEEGCRLGHEIGLGVNAGHGLDYRNVSAVAALAGVAELNIGHSIVSRAIFDGMRRASAEMARLISEASP